MEFQEAAVVRSVPLVETLGKSQTAPPAAFAGLDEDDLTWLDVTAIFSQVLSIQIACVYMMEKTRRLYLYIYIIYIYTPQKKICYFFLIYVYVYIYIYHNFLVFLS